MVVREQLRPEGCSEVKLAQGAWEGSTYLIVHELVSVCVGQEEDGLLPGVWASRLGDVAFHPSNTVDAPYVHQYRVTNKDEHALPLGVPLWRMPANAGQWLSAVSIWAPTLETGCTISLIWFSHSLTGTDQRYVSRYGRR